MLSSGCVLIGCRSSLSPVVNLRTSSSFHLPRTEQDYMKVIPFYSSLFVNLFIKVLKSTYMEGWLEKRSLLKEVNTRSIHASVTNRSETNRVQSNGWKWRWVVLKDGTIYYTKNQIEELTPDTPGTSCRTLLVITGSGGMYSVIYGALHSIKTGSGQHNYRSRRYFKALLL